MNTVEKKNQSSHIRYSKSLDFTVRKKGGLPSSTHIYEPHPKQFKFVDDFDSFMTTREYDKTDLTSLFTNSRTSQPKRIPTGVLSYRQSLMTRTNLTFTSYLSQLEDQLVLLGFESKKLYLIAFKLLQVFTAMGFKDVKISRTSENELLFYREKDGNYKNIMIDENNYIVFMDIPVERGNTYNEVYECKEIEPKELAKKLLFV